MYKYIFYMFVKRGGKYNTYLNKWGKSAEDENFYLIIRYMKIKI